MTNDTTLDRLEGLLAEATPGPWEWVDPETDLPCMPDSPCEAGDHDEHAYRFSLRTVEEFPTAHVGMLPKFIISHAEEFHEVEAAPGVWKHPDAALIVALVNAAPALIAAARALDLYVAWQEEARERLASLADRLDEHSYQELDSILSDGASDEFGDEYESRLAKVARERDAVLEAMTALADKWEHGALRWAEPLPVPSEVGLIREALTNALASATRDGGAE